MTMWRLWNSIKWDKANKPNKTPNVDRAAFYNHYRARSHNLYQMLYQFKHKSKNKGYRFDIVNYNDAFKKLLPKYEAAFKEYGGQRIAIDAIDHNKPITTKNIKFITLGEKRSRGQVLRAQREINKRKIIEGNKNTDAGIPTWEHPTDSLRFKKSKKEKAVHSEVPRGASPKYKSLLRPDIDLGKIEFPPNVKKRYLKQTVIECVEDGRFFSSSFSAKYAYNISENTVIRSCRSGRPCYIGKTFRRVKLFEVADDPDEYVNHSLYHLVVSIKHRHRKGLMGNSRFLLGTHADTFYKLLPLWERAMEKNRNTEGMNEFDKGRLSIELIDDGGDITIDNIRFVPIGLSRAYKRKNHKYVNKPVVCIDDNKRFESVRDAVDHYRKRGVLITESTISKSCYTRAFAGGKRWMYVGKNE